MHDGNFKRRRVDTPLGQPLTDPAEEWRKHLRHPAANHDNLWLEQVNDVSDPDCQQVSRVFERRFGDWIAGCEGFAHHFAGDGARIAVRQA